MNKQKYIKIENCPFDLDFFKNIPIYDINNKQYVKINVLCEEWKSMFLVDVELTEQIDNKNAGENTGFGTTPLKDFLPCKTCYIEVF